MRDVLFISPHPDDETLSMGMGIANHVWNGFNVYAALLAIGDGSSAIECLNGSIYCSWHKRYHKPQAEGYTPLSIQKFSDARIDEFRYSTACLGVKHENIRVFDFHDGSITKDAVKNIIMDFMSRHPGAAVKAPSYYDIHPDHSACGQALMELYNDGDVNDARFYISPGQRDSVQGYYEASPNCSVFCQASLAVYKRWNPRCDIFGVGYHSVSNLFDIVSNNPRSKYHFPGM